MQRSYSVGKKNVTNINFSASTIIKKKKEFKSAQMPKYRYLLLLQQKQQQQQKTPITQLLNYPPLKDAATRLK